MSPAAGARGIHNPSGRVHPEPVADTTAQKSMAIPLAAFAAGAVVALLVGLFGRVHDPTLAGTTTLGYPTVLAMKTVVATAAGVLAVLQLVTALWIFGRLGIRAPARMWQGR